MKLEPLNGKIYYLDTRYPMTIDKVPKFVKTEIEIFFREDLKSAVQGLFEEIKIEKERYKEIKEVISGLSIAEELIKKWLADVVSEDG